MKFDLDGEIIDLSEAEVQELIKTFLDLFAEARGIIRHVWVFGGTVREPEKVHGDIDLLIEVPLLPEFEDVKCIAEDWADVTVDYPELALIDCFFQTGDKVGSFRHDLMYVELFDVTDKPRTGGLDDDDTEIYIGPKVEFS